MSVLCAAHCDARVSVVVGGTEPLKSWPLKSGLSFLGLSIRFLLGSRGFLPRNHWVPFGFPMASEFFYAIFELDSDL